MAWVFEVLCREVFGRVSVGCLHLACISMQASNMALGILDVLALERA
jgi:hypothetical protein